MNRNRFKALCRLFGTVIRVRPRVFFFEYFMMFVDAIATAAILPLLSRFFSTLERALSASRSNGEEIVQALLLLLAVYVLAEIAGGCSHYCGEIYSNLSVGGLRKQLHEQLRALPTLAYEKPEVMETVQSAYAGTYRIRSMLNAVMDFGVFYFPYFMSYAYYLYRMDAKLTLLLPCLFVPLIVAQVHKAKSAVRYEKELGTCRRTEEAYMRYQQTPDIVRELRSLGADYFLKTGIGVCSKKSCIF